MRIGLSKKKKNKLKETKTNKVIPKLVIAQLRENNSKKLKTLPILLNKHLRNQRNLKKSQKRSNKKNYKQKNTLS